MNAYPNRISANLAPTIALRTDPSLRTVDTVLGYAVGCDADEVAPFIRSLRSVFSGRVIVVVDRNPTLRAYLRTHKVEMETAPHKTLRWRPQPVVERFAALADILDHHADIRDVVITDVRDVVFQGDPFAGMEDGLQFFLEAEGRSLGRHAFNLKRLRRLMGEAVARELSDRPCVSAGVIAGPAVAVTRFYRTLLLSCAIPRSRAGRLVGGDQAACNLIAHLNLTGGRIRPNFGRVATVGLTALNQLGLVDGRIVNPDGSYSPIVHQYDRVGVLADHVHARWGVSAAAERLRQNFRAGSRRLQASTRGRLPGWR